MSKFIKNKLSFTKRKKKYHFHHFIFEKENKKANFVLAKNDTMRVVIQRVRHCSVSIDNKLFSEIEKDYWFYWELKIQIQKKI